MSERVQAEDTIVATACPAGVGALSIVRLSGQDAHRMVMRLVGDKLPPIRTAARRKVRSADGQILDESIVVCYRGPQSYTGEDAVEIICHGGWVSPVRITQALVEAGARPALPGEFTRRAVLNGKLDLLQAEAVNDLIRAESTAAANLALQQLDGGLSQRIVQLRSDILDVEALVAYEIDFPEEDDGPVDEPRILDAIQRVIDSIDALIATTPAGELVRQGAVVVIVGPPNVGKSSLFNALLGRKRALVTEIPGTTRDALEAVLDVVPVPLRLVDTAGLRETQDQVERLGVEVSREYLTQAAAVLACGDSEETLADALNNAGALARGAIIPVRTKVDLLHGAPPHGLGVSAVTGAGLETLLNHVSTLLAEKSGLPAEESPIVTHARYRYVLTRAREELTAFQATRLENTVPVTVSAVHLREGVRVIEELIGGVDVEDVLGKVFSSFCVGK